MIFKIFPFLFSAFLLTLVFCLPQGAACEEPKSVVPDKALCAKMLAFGKQAYQRGRYLDAKEYFRKAVQADPASNVAWLYYDMVVIFGLAEKVEKNKNLVAPDTSVRGHAGPGTPPPVKPPQAGPAKKLIIEDDEEEGC